MAVSTWNAPARQTIRGGIDAGAIVSVRIRRQKSEPLLVPDPRGIIPHLLLIPTIEPAGTGAALAMNAFGEVYEVSERPTQIADGQITGEEQIAFWVDLGCAFVAPWPLTIALEGGAVVGGVQSAHDVSVIVTMPQDVAITNEVLDGDGHPIARTLSRRTGPSPVQPLGSPTISYRAVPPGAGIQIPRGVWALSVPSTTSIAFPGALGPPSTLVLTAQAGAPIALGDLAQGTFEAAPAPAPSIDLVSFHLVLA